MLLDNFKDRSGSYVKTFMFNGQNWTKSGRTWHNMKQRCNAEGAEQKRRSGYMGCSMSDNFKDFNFFVEWHEKQIGFDQENYHIDKDILVKDNKIYSEDTCVLVPHELNNFFTNSGASRGDYPLGVYLNAPNSKLRACIRIDNKTKYLGQFETIPEASAAYKAAKETEALRWITRLDAGEFVVSPKVIEALKNRG